ncbi:TetR/AcrR family transcriptional regulator [Methylobacterium dankookense]|uniref:HTH-type transcriptional regulator BetI n=1 Tax=Methylobacterium dankookense TaxID=560405 RepID=A0A564FY64_9HYPH|nr:TetR/AcrR family transcriptional regulator [Methylobacterium dankookense]GJD55632.1 HTH-type transcriptional regulator BetI [Methylobacterium dankookense]VUF12814.1 HTH-type transcriptional repressor KstR2 [Methylobacterium dankookense]
MTTAYRRKKQPELVRRTLLDCAATLALEQGLAAVTVQAVCEAAGVTKGGLFHHFASKQALIDGVVADLLEKLDADIEAAMAKDPVPRGRFTRAYVTVTLDDLMLNQSSQWTALYISSLTEPSLRRVTADWFARGLERYRETDGDPVLEMVRLAADGAWLAALLRDDGGPMPDLPALRARLLAMTHTA